MWIEVPVWRIAGSEEHENAHVNQNEQREKTYEEDDQAGDERTRHRRETIPNKATNIQKSG